MNTAELIKTLTSQGFKLTPKGKNLTISGKVKQLSPELIAEIKKRKKELLKILKKQEDFNIAKKIFASPLYPLYEACYNRVVVFVKKHQGRLKHDRELTRWAYELGQRIQTALEHNCVTEKEFKQLLALYEHVMTSARLN